MEPNLKLEMELRQQCLDKIDTQEIKFGAIIVGDGDGKKFGLKKKKKKKGKKKKNTNTTLELSMEKPPVPSKLKR